VEIAASLIVYIINNSYTKWRSFRLTLDVYQENTYQNNSLAARVWVGYEVWLRLRFLLQVTENSWLQLRLWLFDNFFADYDYDFNYTPLIFMIMIICPLTDRLRFWLQVADYNYDYGYKKNTLQKSIHAYFHFWDMFSIHIYNMYKKDVWLTYTCYKHITLLQIISKFCQLASLQVDIAVKEHQISNSSLAWTFCQQWKYIHMGMEIGSSSLTSRNRTIAVFTLLVVSLVGAR
jgi:hypothetical protein